MSAAHKQSLRGNHRRATQHYAAVLELESESSRYGMARDAGIASASLWLAQNVGVSVRLLGALQCPNIAGQRDFSGVTARSAAL
eukprot:SAG11_NODE_245_length_11735_cov_3.939068_9_plen_84_part_00